MAQSKKTTTAKEQFADYLRGNGMRVTPERLSIVEIISKRQGLFTVEELHTQMCRESMNLSYGTLYNTLELLLNASLVKKINTGEAHGAKFTLSTNTAPSIYMCCERCGAIKTATSRQLTTFVGTFDFPNFTPYSSQLMVKGLCKKCQKAIVKIKKQTTNKQIP